MWKFSFNLSSLTDSLLFIWMGKEVSFVHVLFIWFSGKKNYSWVEYIFQVMKKRSVIFSSDSLRLSWAWGWGWTAVRGETLLGTFKATFSSFLVRWVDYQGRIFKVQFLRSAVGSFKLSGWLGFGFFSST